MTSANVTTEGQADGQQKSQWVHQIIAAFIFILLHKSYAEYQHTMNYDE